MSVDSEQTRTCLKVSWMASYLRSSRTFMSSMMDLEVHKLIQSFLVDVAVLLQLCVALLQFTEQLMPCLLVIFSSSLVSLLMASFCSFSMFFQRSMLFMWSLISTSILSTRRSRSGEETLDEAVQQK
ncbi:hypothetical protein F7725_016195 [Dissostichus mawsoni]|uniref:Uncharacterized protein n=1 Tax=Dissostichus mawsoni TaxID=36200 RepID=A0A7J5Y682_DISMA|nr:hypothetical protein F7725_016195 [Dissostichus mawsoni]